MPNSQQHPLRVPYGGHGGTLRRQLGIVALAAGTVDEVLILLEHVNIIREILPAWLAGQRTVFALIAAGFGGGSC